MTSGKKIFFYATIAIVSLYFLFLGLVKAKGFLIPLVSAIILALMILPLGQWLEDRRVSRGLASFLSTFALFLSALGFLVMISFQVQNFTQKWPQIKENIKPQMEETKAFIFEHTQLNLDDLQQSGGSLPFLETRQNEQGTAAQETSDSASKSQGENGSIPDKGKKALSYLMKTAGFLGTFLLVFIYIFFMLNYRRRFRNFLLRLFPSEKKSEVKAIIHKSAQVTQQYLVGKLLLSAALAVLYAIGLGISGVSNFILISILAAFLAFLPYIGNIIGLCLALSFGFLTSGDTGVLIGILITFSVAQFVESYFLEPYVVGDKVDLHPFFVILVVVLGNSLWEIMGMLLAIPILAIITVVLLHIPPLYPVGFLFSNRPEGNKSSKKNSS